MFLATAEPWSPRHTTERIADDDRETSIQRDLLGRGSADDSSVRGVYGARRDNLRVISPHNSIELWAWWERFLWLSISWRGVRPLPHIYGSIWSDEWQLSRIATDRYPLAEWGKAA